MNRNKVKLLIKKSLDIEENKELNKIMEQISFKKIKRKYPKLLFPLIIASISIIFLFGALFIFKENKEYNACLEYNTEVLKEACSYLKKHDIESFYQYSNLELENAYAFNIYKAIDKASSSYYYQLFSKTPSNNYKIVLFANSYNVTIYSSIEEKNIMGLIDCNQNQELQIKVFYNNNLENTFSQKI